MVKNPPASREETKRQALSILRQEDPLEEEMSPTLSSVLLEHGMYGGALAGYSS